MIYHKPIDHKFNYPCSNQELVILDDDFDGIVEWNGVEIVADKNIIITTLDRKGVKKRYHRDFLTMGDLEDDDEYEDFDE